MDVIINKVDKLLITGCAGFIGMHLCKSLLEDGYEVFGIDINSNVVELVNKKKSPIKDSDIIEYLEKKLKELDPSGEILRQFFRYWNSTPSGLGSPLRRKVDP